MTVGSTGTFAVGTVEVGGISRPTTVDLGGLTVTATVMPSVFMSPTVTLGSLTASATVTVTYLTIAKVEVAFGKEPFDQASLDVPGNWTDVSTSVRSATYTTSSRSDRFSVFTAGSASVVLNDTDREFDPSHPGSTHVGQFKRGVPVRIVGTDTLGDATFDVTGGVSEDLWTLAGHGMAVGQRVQFSVTGGGADPYGAFTDYFVVAATTNTFQLSTALNGAVLAGSTGDSTGTWTIGRLDSQWYGYARTWTPSYQGKDAVTALVAVDGLGMVARYDLDEITAAYAGDAVGTRMGRVLDDLGFPASYRDLDQGTTLTETTFGVNALQHCQIAAASDGGFLYAQRDGTITFDGMSALTDSRQLTSQITFSDSVTPTYLADSIHRTGVGEGFRNVVRVGGGSVTTATVDSTATNAAPVTYQRLDLLMSTDAQASGLASFYADLYSTETPVTSEVTFLVAAVSELSYNAELFHLKLRDRVTVDFAPPGGGSALSDQCFIDGISGSITPARWDVTFHLSSADIYDNNLAAAPSAWMVLDDASNGILDTDVLGY